MILNDTSPKRDVQAVGRGMALMALAMTVLPVMDVFAKLLSQTMPSVKWGLRFRTEWVRSQLSKGEAEAALESEIHLADARQEGPLWVRSRHWADRAEWPLLTQSGHSHFRISSR